jgi:hypothetical protein
MENKCKERKVDAMKYMESGIEIQYRECQILRETAGEILKDADCLIQFKEDWIGLIEQAAHTNELKASYAAPMAVFLRNLSDDLFEAVSEYAGYLVNKGRGIDVMVPYKTQNRRIILPVNLHAAMEYMED